MHVEGVYTSDAVSDSMLGALKCFVTLFLEI